MYFIKLMELAEGKIYNGEDSIVDLVGYVMNFRKISDEALRVRTTYAICAGFLPCPFPEQYRDNPDAAISIMRKNTAYWGKGFDDVLKHRIVSFDASDLVLPQDLNILGNVLIEYYAKLGFIACYGVHRDTYYYHIHVAANTRSYQDGRKMNIYYESNQLQEIVKQWNELYMLPKLENPKVADRYKNVIFGDDYVPLSRTALGAVGQIKAYKELCDKR